jgi:hypothetical protein
VRKRSDIVVFVNDSCDASCDNDQKWLLSQPELQQRNRISLSKFGKNNDENWPEDSIAVFRAVFDVVVATRILSNKWEITPHLVTN